MSRAARFGYEIGGGTLLVAMLLARRDAVGPAVAATAVGVLLLATAALRPSALAPVASAWLAVGDAIARVTNPILLTLIYLVVVTPIGVLRRRVWGSPIHRSTAATSFWVRRERSTPEEARAAMEHQF